MRSRARAAKNARSENRIERAACTDVGETVSINPRETDYSSFYVLAQSSLREIRL
jgi:hypothetical protein